MPLRQYQEDNLNAPTRAFLFNQPEVARAVGQVYAPTGAGKTECFIDLLVEAVARGMRNIAILHPRIALSQDQVERFQRAFGNNINITSFHSGAHPVGNTMIGQVSTTNPADLINIINTTHNVMGKPHFTFSSYHSFDKLIQAGIHFDIVICDEAHYLVQPQFNSMVANIPATRVLFYTATPITTELEGTTMDLVQFGEKIAEVTPNQLIPMGYILAPLVHELQITTDQAGDIDPVDVIARAYVHQYDEVCNGVAGSMPYAQMLVAARGVNGESADIEVIENNLLQLWDKIRELSNGRLGQVDVYTVAADRHNINGRPANSRTELLRTLKDSNANAILVHYDTLSEGIDINTLTGVVMMRKMNKAKIIQTIGRCARPYMADLDPVTREPRHGLFDIVAGVDTRAKRRCIVTLPCVDGAWMGREDGTEIADAFIAGGYDSLVTYMEQKQEDDPQGGDGEDTLELPKEPVRSIHGSALQHHVDRKLSDLRSLLNVA